MTSITQGPASQPLNRRGKEEKYMMAKLPSPAAGEEVLAPRLNG